MPERGERLPIMPVRVSGFECDEAYFPSVESALDSHVQQHGSAYHMITTPLEGGIQGRMLIVDEVEYLELEMGDRRGRAVRSVGDRPGITVSTDYNGLFDLCIRVGSYEDPILDRGTLWVHLSNPSSTRISVGIRSDHPAIGTADLARLITNGEIAAYGVINSILNNTFNPSSQRKP